MQQAYYFPPGLCVGICDTHASVPAFLSYQQFCKIFVPQRPDIFDSFVLKHHIVMVVFDIL